MFPLAFSLAPLFQQMPAGLSLSALGPLKVFLSMRSASLVNSLLDFSRSLVPVRAEVCRIRFNRGARLESIGTEIAVFVDAPTEHVGSDSRTAHDGNCRPCLDFFVLG